jgi:hypothetical protein
MEQDNRFYEGQKLLALYWPEGHVAVGKNRVIDITVVMEYGEMAGVPWALTKNEDGISFKYNLKTCEAVRIS